MQQSHKFRIVTYNIHKCRGMDRRVQPERIVQVLRDLDPDIAALQEVLSAETDAPRDNQAEYIAKELGMKLITGYTRKHQGHKYGNIILTKFPVNETSQYDVSVPRREPRGVLRADIELAAGRVLHVFNVHLGTDYLERRYQAKKLLDEKLLKNKKLQGVRIILGDFNEWTHGLTTRMLSQIFKNADIREHLKISATFPGRFPFLHLDHIYFDTALQLDKLMLHRSKTALVASDHLPLVGDFYLHAMRDAGVIGL